MKLLHNFLNINYQNITIKIHLVIDAFLLLISSLSYESHDSGSSSDNDKSNDTEESGEEYYVPFSDPNLPLIDLNSGEESSDAESEGFVFRVLCLNFNYILVSINVKIMFKIG